MNNVRHALPCLITGLLLSLPVQANDHKVLGGACRETPLTTWR